MSGGARPDPPAPPARPGAMLLRIHHRTTFTYAGLAHESYNEVRLCPLNDAHQHCREFRLAVAPAAEAREHRDFYGNTVHTFEVAERHPRLVIEAWSEVQTTPGPGEPVPAVALENYDCWVDRELLVDFVQPSAFVPLDDAVRGEAESALGGGRGDVWKDVRRLGGHVYRTCAYEPNATRVDTRATDVLALRRGVCQDFAHLHLALCRSLGIAVRYVSGYFFNTTRRPGEVEASHAWIEACLPGRGWTGWDATHDRAVDERYVKVAVGRDYADIRPVNGTYRGAPGLGLEVEVSVEQVSGNDGAGATPGRV